MNQFFHVGLVSGRSKHVPFVWSLFIQLQY
jgi:hypothetical protein